MARREHDNPQLDDVGITLFVDGERQRLTPAEARLVLEQFPGVRSDALRWKLKLGTPGRLLLLDRGLCNEIRTFLDGSS